MSLVGIVVLTLLGLGSGAVLGWVGRGAGRTDERLVDAIDALLPQTQCAQCGYPGCRPYATAIAEGAPLDRCPPGGEDTLRSLAALLGRPARALAEDLAAENLDSVARIDEEACIGCALCLPACPVDAIAGASGYLHTVLTRDCTGCELCVPACPVDCIDMRARDPAATLRWLSR